VNSPTAVQPEPGPTAGPQPAAAPLRVECPPGACVCDRARVLADPQLDQRPLTITRQQELKLIERIERVDSLADLQHVQGLIHKNIGATLHIAPVCARRCGNRCRQRCGAA
jgi:predicted Zn-ribbon and HTH transcriptional regulator